MDWGAGEGVRVSEACLVQQLVKAHNLARMQVCGGVQGKGWGAPCAAADAGAPPKMKWRHGAW